VIKESKAMKEIHKIRETFYRETKGKGSEYVLHRIKEGSKKMRQKLEAIQPNPELIIREEYRIKQFDSTKQIQQIREREEKYGK
jgi:hypothetical protein